MGLGMIVAVDFDDTLCDSSNIKEGKQMGEPIPGAIAAMKELKGKGYIVVVHTVRGDRPKHVEDWLKYYGCPFDVVTNIKVPAMVYIDDRALRFNGDWLDTLDELDAL